jgi:hypothetical protein
VGVVEPAAEWRWVMARVEVFGKEIGPELSEAELFVVLDWLQQVGAEDLSRALRGEPLLESSEEGTAETP